MHSPSLLIALLLATVSFGVQAAPEFLPLDADKLREMELHSIAPFPYDEFVLVLEGRVTLTNIDGGKQTYGQGDTFLVPKGWLGTWDMPDKYCEMIVIETKAWLAAEE